MHDISLITGIILLLTVGISLFTWYKRHDLLEKFMFYPYRIDRKNTWYEFITHGFVHGGLGHLFFNMLALYFFGPALELTIGPLYFLMIYFVSMVVASIPDYMKHRKNPNYRSLGASGAIAGLLFSVIIFYPQMNILFLFRLEIPAPIFAVLYLAYSWFADRHGEDNIGHSAHMWGALTGFLLTLLFWPDAFQGFIDWVSYKLSF